MANDKDITRTAIAALLGGAELAALGLPAGQKEAIVDALLREGQAGPFPMTAALGGVTVEIDARLRLMAGDEGLRIEVAGIEPPAPDEEA